MKRRLLAVAIAWAVCANARADLLSPAATAEIIRTIKGAITEQVSALQFIVESNTIDCLQLQLEGIVFWLRVTPLGIEIIPTLEVSHYNPDFIVSTFPRIGASPIMESDALYSSVGTEVAAAVLELLHGEPVPSVFDREDEFGGRMSESNNGRSISMFSEAEVIGHPGNILSLAALATSGRIASLPNDVLALVPSIANAPNDILDGIGNAGDLLDSASATLVPSTTGNLSNEAPGGGLGDLSTWIDQVIIPRLLGREFMEALALYGEAVDLVDRVNQIPALETIAEDVSGLLEEPLTAIAGAVMNSDSVSDITGSVTDAIGGVDALTMIFDLLRDGVDSSDEFEELLGVLQESGYAPQAIDNIMQSVEGLDSAMQEGGQLSEMQFSFCPSDTLPLAPYYLSSLNVLSWRFGLPELAYRRSYAFPTPGTELFVGTFGTGTVDDLTDHEGHRVTWTDQLQLPNWSTWGNIYPRQGWVAQPDEVKNRAVAAFRAAHVVTRSGEPHVYLHAHARTYGFKRNDIAPLSPIDIESGAWQMVHPKKADQCTLLQDSEIETALGVPRNPDITSDDGTYIYNLWRWYRCAPRPTGSTELFTLDLGGIPLL